MIQGIQNIVQRNGNFVNIKYIPRKKKTKKKFV